MNVNHQRDSSQRLYWIVNNPDISNQINGNYPSTPNPNYRADPYDGGKSNSNNPLTNILGDMHPRNDKFAKKAYGQYLLDQVQTSPSTACF